MYDFRRFIQQYIKLISHEERHINSKLTYLQERASKHLDRVLPDLRKITQIYVKKFCNEPVIKSNPVYLTAVRDILTMVREHVDVELPKTYAKLLQTRMR